MVRSTSWRSWCSTLLMGVALVACTPDEEENLNQACGDTIVTRINPKTDFSTIKTFAVVDKAGYPIELPGDLPSNANEHVFAANHVAAAKLIAKGLTEVDPKVEEPDVWLFSLASTEKKTGYEWACVPGYTWWGWSGWDYDCAWWDEVPVEYKVGTVVIGLAKVTDDKPAEVVFGGAVQGALLCGDPPARLEEGVQKIFAKYPGRDDHD